MRYSVIILLCAALTSGCASVQVAMYDKNIHYPATDPATVEIFQKKPENRTFTEIGEITVDGANTMSQAERVFRIKAAEYGGDAVYVFKTVEQPVTSLYPRECYFYDDYYYPRRRYYHPGYRYRYHDLPYYYYCYGYPEVRTSVFLTVTGIVIRFGPPGGVK